MPGLTLGKSVPIYNSQGEWCSLLVFPYIFNTLGEWVGWITPDRQVYDVDGVYVGWLTEEPRILRRRVYEETLPRRTPPAPPERVRPPATVPLARMMAELPFEYVDVLREEPDRLHTTDSGEFKEDVD